MAKKNRSNTLNEASAKIKAKQKSSNAKVQKKRCEKNYTTEALKQALNAYGQGRSLREAASMFGIPKSTLYINCFTPNEIRKCPATVLTANEEENIVQWILECGQRGFSVNRRQLLDCVQKFVLESNRQTPFKKGRPGKYWYYAFMKRHPILSDRICQNLTSPRAAVTEENLRAWFSKIKNYIEKKM